MVVNWSLSLTSLDQLAPGALMDRAFLIEMLDQFEKADFDSEAVLEVSQERAQELARQFGCPREQVLAKAGIAT
jgi:hypothetical protein